MFFIAEKQQKAILNFSLDSLNVTGKLGHQKILNLLNDVCNSRFVTKNGTLSMISQTQVM